MNGFDKFELNARRDAKATALTAAIVARKAAEAAEREAKKEYDEACIEYGRAHVPEGFVKGDAVQRSTVKRGGYDIGFRGTKNPDRTVTERGVVTLCEGLMNYHNHYPKPGEWFVLSKSGQTAYPLFDKDGNALWTKEA